MKKITKEQVIDILEYNMAMLTCDMSLTRDPEHQDVSPDYYGKDAEDLYYACEYCLKYITKESIPVKWLKDKSKWLPRWSEKGMYIDEILEDWSEERGQINVDN